MGLEMNDKLYDCMFAHPSSSQCGCRPCRDQYLATPIPLRIVCPECGTYHIDEGKFATKPHHTHACQQCGNVWRPAIVNTVGVRFLPGFKNESQSDGGVES
jgi:hypothetical protein